LQDDELDDSSSESTGSDDDKDDNKKPEQHDGEAMEGIIGRSISAQTTTSGDENTRLAILQ
jgi:hypothetical protein